MESKLSKVDTLMNLEDFAKETIAVAAQLVCNAAMEIAFTDRELALEILKNKDQLRPDTALAKLFLLAETLGINFANVVALYALSPSD
jgi:hypothetical protein